MKRLLLALISVGLGLGGALAGALLTSGPGGVNTFIEGLSTGSSGVVEELGVLLPFGFAFAAGMVSAVNPCGFVLLPTYLGVFLGDSQPARSGGIAGRLVRGLAIGGLMTLAFVAVFLLAGIVVGLLASAVVGALPWLGLAVGIGLVLAGGYQLAGGALHAAIPLPALESPAQTMGPYGGKGGAVGLRAYFAYGLAYGTASLSCTLPIFLAVVGGSLASAELVPALGQLVLYGLGMGSLVVALTLVAALLKTTALARARGMVRIVQPAGTFFLFVAGTYVVYYWLTVGGLLHVFIARAD